MPRRLTDADYRKAAAQAGIPYRLLVAVLGQEGGTNPDGSFKTSPKGARGPAQLMPGTAAGLERKYRINTKTAYGNLLGGAYYLAEQKKTFGDWELALAAYNAGPNAVREYGDVPPYKETQNYVRNIMAKAGVLTGASQGATVSPSTVPQGGAPGALASGGAPSLPDTKSVAMQGLRDMVEGDWNPSRALQGLVDARAAAQAAPRQTGAQTGSQGVTGASPQASAPITNVKGGFTYRGEPLTHDTDGLPGYPARDMFAKPGTPFLAPEDGRVIRHSGKGGTSGNVYGYSVYFRGKSGRIYYITHLNKQRARGTVKAGQPLGSVSAWDGGSPHAHVGVKGKGK